jgi:multicomponent Na+:H+ antiporter subunit D
MFLALGCCMYRLGSVHIRDLAGLGRTMPLTAAALVAGGLGLIGVPLTAGFISKWYLVLGAIERGWWPVAVLIMLSSLLAVAYVWRMVEAMYFNPPPETVPEGMDTRLSMLIPTWVLIGASLYFGVQTDLTVGVARDAAMALLGTPR